MSKDNDNAEADYQSKGIFISPIYFAIDEIDLFSTPVALKTCCLG